MGEVPMCGPGCWPHSKFSRSHTGSSPVASCGAHANQDQCWDQETFETPRSKGIQICLTLPGYLAHEKTPTPLGPP